MITLLVWDQYKGATGSLFVMSPSMLHRSWSCILPLEHASKHKVCKKRRKIIKTVNFNFASEFFSRICRDWKITKINCYEQFFQVVTVFQMLLSPVDLFNLLAMSSFFQIKTWKSSCKNLLIYSNKSQVLWNSAWGKTLSEIPFSQALCRLLLRFCS